MADGRLVRLAKPPRKGKLFQKKTCFRSSGMYISRWAIEDRVRYIKVLRIRIMELRRVRYVCMYSRALEGVRKEA